MSKLPDAVAKRDMVFHGAKKLPSAQLSEQSNKFEKAGWQYDAIEFARHADRKDLLESFQQKAVADGDVFLLQRTAVPAKPSSDLLKQCCVNAEAKGKFRYALKGYELLADEENVQRLKGQLGLLPVESTETT